MDIKTIKKEVNYTQIIDKSKFITFAFPCNSIDEFNSIHDKLKKEYFDATHICYAYMISNGNTIFKSYDDGEPSQTAGAPILNVILKKGLSNIAIFVIRYFGGIKLGAGGLVRAYSSSASECIKDASIVTLKDGYRCTFIFDYDSISFLDQIVKANNINIINKNYDDKVSYTFETIDEDLIERLLNVIRNENITLNKEKVSIKI